MPTPATLTVALQNRTGSNNAYAYITGRAIDNGNALFFLQSDGRTPYYPESPSNIQTPLGVDCAIPLGRSYSTNIVTIPHLAGARLWFSVDNTLTFKLNPGPATVEPSVTNPSDPNYNINWGFAEFTYNDAQMFANISYVDFVSLPISLVLHDASGAIQRVTGMPEDGLDQICDGLREQDDNDHAGWSNLIVQQNGRNLRALSPNSGIVMNRSLFSGYYQPYVDQVWDRYSSDQLAVNTQAQWGTVQGKVTNGDLVLDTQTFSKPAAADIFSCSTGPFAENGIPERAALIPRLAAAFNRSTLLDDNVTPTTGDDYYEYPITNHYSRIVHSVNLDGRGYAFPYDDVAPDNGQDQSGSVSSGNPSLLTVAVGGLGAGPVADVKEAAVVPETESRKEAAPATAKSAEPAAAPPVPAAELVQPTTDASAASTSTVLQDTPSSQQQQLTAPKKGLKTELRRLLKRFKSS